jgi:hypothetical protein
VIRDSIRVPYVVTEIVEKKESQPWWLPWLAGVVGVVVLAIVLRR